MESFLLDNEEYLLTKSEAKEVDKANLDFPVSAEGDIAFNKWFKEFLDRKRIRPVNRRMARYWTGATNSTDDDVKLAMTLRSQQSVLDVMDTTNSLTVKYSEQGASEWDGGSEVRIPSKPAKDQKDLFDAINVTSGFTVHEGGHSKHTRKINTVKLRSYRAQCDINNILVNLLEDERSEAMEMEINPGFRQYLSRKDEYLWDSCGEQLLKSLPKKFEDSEYQHRMAVAIMSGDNAIHERVFERIDPSWHPLMEAVRNLAMEYAAKGEEVKDQTAIDTSDRLKSILDITPADERDSNTPDGKRKLDGAKNMQGCQANDEDEADKLDKEMTRRVADLVESEVEKLEPGDPFFYPDGSSAPSEIHVFKPKLQGKGHLPPLDGLLAKAKAAFEFRKATPRADERLMQSGELDEDDLYRLMQGDMRVFRDITEEVLPSAAVYLLVDMSGSMSSSFSGTRFDFSMAISGESRKTVAFKMAYLMVKALHNRPNVKTRVLGHTGEVWDKTGVRNGAQFYRLWEEGDKLERLDLINQLQPGENYDSYAIGWAGKLLQDEEADQKLLIVLSDGKPAGNYYGGDKAMRHVRSVTDALKRKGVDTIQLSMARDLTQEDQRKMFEHYIPAPKSDKPYAEFLRQFTRLLEKVGRKVN